MSFLRWSVRLPVDRIRLSIGAVYTALLKERKSLFLSRKKCRLGEREKEEEAEKEEEEQDRGREMEEPEEERKKMIS